MFVDRYEISASLPRFLASSFGSFMVHVTFITLLYMELEFRVQDFENLIPETIDVEIIELDDIPMHKPSGDKREIKENIEIDPTAFEAKKIENQKTEEQIKYEKKLSNYLGSVLEKVIPKQYKKFRINLLIEVDREGRIVNSKTFGTKDLEIDKFLKHMLFIANPVPIPPETYFKSATIKFAIPLQNVQRK